MLTTFDYFQQDYSEQLTEEDDIFNDLDPNEKLIFAVISKRYDLTFKAISESGANVNIRYHESTVLMIASKFGNFKIVQILVLNGADVNAVNREFSALNYAILGGHVDVINYLLCQGAQFKHVEFCGKPFLLYCVQHFPLQIVRFLIENYSVDINITDRDGRTALHVASLFRKTDTAKYLIEVGAELNFQDFRLRTPLICAAYTNNNQIAKLLVEAGAVLNFQDTRLNTALIFSAKIKNQDMVSYLIDQDANCELCDEDGKCVYDYLPVKQIGFKCSSYCLSNFTIEPIN